MWYYIKRLGQALFTLYATLTATFFLTRWMPGGPLDFIRAQMVAGNVGIGGGGEISGNPERVEQFNEIAKLYVNIDPSKPLHIQYVEYFVQVLTGDLGQSIWFSQPVEAVLIPAIPWTVFLGAIAVFISFVSRVIVGAALAYREGGWLDVSTTTALTWAQGLPFYIVAILLVYLFGFQLGWFPIGGRMNQYVEPGLNWPFVAGLLEHATLPVLSLAWASFGAGALAMRANSIQILGEDYLRVARLRGVSKQRLSILYVARNAILPMYTSMLIQIGFVFSGSVLLEAIFQYPGVGFYLFRGIQARDFPLMMGAFILITIAVVIAMFVADVTYGIIDPRVTRGGNNEAY